MFETDPASGASPDWDAMARDYAAGLLPVKEIAALYGVSRATLYNHAKSGGWPLRCGKAVTPLKRSRAGLTKRLLAALDVKMSQFEARIGGNAGSETAADSERDARTLNALVRLFEKLSAASAPGFGKAAARPSDDAPSPATEMKPDDAERIRNDLAQRLEALRRQLGG